MFRPKRRKWGSGTELGSVQGVNVPSQTMEMGLRDGTQYEFMPLEGAPAISTNSECLGITPGHLSCIDYAIIK